MSDYDRDRRRRYSDADYEGHGRDIEWEELSNEGRGGDDYAQRRGFRGTHWEPGGPYAGGGYASGHGFGGPGGGYGPSGYSAYGAGDPGFRGTHWEPVSTYYGSGYGFGGPGSGYGPSGYSAYGAGRRGFRGTHWEPGGIYYGGGYQQREGHGFGGPGSGYGPSGYSAYGAGEGPPTGYHQPFIVVGQAWSAPGPYVGRGPRGYQRSDERILDDACDRLWLHGQLDASDIEVAVQNGEVTLSGTVDSRRSKRLAEDIIDTVPGVQEIHNRLRVRRPAEGQQRGDEEAREVGR